MISVKNLYFHAYLKREHLKEENMKEKDITFLDKHKYLFYMKNFTQIFKKNIGKQSYLVFELNCKQFS